MPERQSFVLCPLSFVLIGEAVRPATFAARLAPPYLGILPPPVTLSKLWPNVIQNAPFRASFMKMFCMLAIIVMP